MAEKRRIVVRDEESDPSTAEERETGRPEEDDSFKAWLRKDYARYWFWVLVLAADGFAGIYIAQIGGSSAPIIVLIFLVLAIVGEIFLYLRIWPRDESDQ